MLFADFFLSSLFSFFIFIQGAWRKVTVDDWMPFDDEGKLLLPATTNEHELWPMLLSKALIKVASLE